MNFPDYVKTERHQIIFGFLSHLADHFDKNTFWIKSQHTIYKSKLNNIPETFLRSALWKFLGSDAMRITAKTKYAPSVTNVFEYVKSCQGFLNHWLSVQLDQTYCRACRTDEIGKTGGYRQIFYYGYVPDLGKVAEDTHWAGACDCPLGRKMPAANYETVMIKLQERDPNAEIAVDKYCFERNRKISAREQTNYHWDNLLSKGYVRLGIEELGEYTDQLYPVWENEFWSGPLGPVSAALYGFEMPADLAAIRHQNQTAIRKHGALNQLRRSLAKEGNMSNVMRQMGDFF